MTGKKLQVHNGEITDAPRVCDGCQTPNPDVQASDGEWYHHECVPEGL